jgi:release factor glutamine methyltransferase
VKVVVATAARLLRPGGLLVVEHADVQGDAVTAVLRDAGGWTAVADHEDLGGRPRYTTGRREHA